MLLTDYLKGKLKDVWLEYPTYFVKFVFLFVFSGFAKSRQGALTAGMMACTDWSARRVRHVLASVDIILCLSGIVSNIASTAVM
jgi:hypothetical protein